MNKNQGHGDHIGAIIDTKSFISQHLQPLINKGKITHRITIPAESDTNKGNPTEVIVLLNDDESISWQMLLAKGREHFEFVTCYPVLAPNIRIPATIVKVEPWSNLIEATVTCMIDNNLTVAFFATDYAWNKDRYIVGYILNLDLAALAYSAKEASRGFKFEGQQAIDFLSKIGKKPDYDEKGNMMPVNFSTENLVAFMNVNEDYPDDAQYQSPLETISYFKALNTEFTRGIISIKHDPDRKVPLYFKRDFLPDASSGTPVQGVLWLQGCISAHQFTAQHDSNVFGDKGKEFINNLEEPLEDGEMPSGWQDVEWILEPLDLIQTPEGYVLDAFHVADEHDDEYQLYFSKEGSTKKYKSVKSQRRVPVDQTEEEKRLGIQRFEFQSVVPPFDDTMYLAGTYEYDVAKTIPDIWDYVSVPFTPMGVWQAFLLNETFRFLPHFWHSSYVDRSYIFQIDDIIQIQKRDKSEPELTQEDLQKLKEYASSDELLPKVKVDGNSAVISICYWNAWQGLIKLEIPVTKRGRTVQFGRPTGETLIEYDCGIIF